MAFVATASVVDRQAATSSLAHLLEPTYGRSLRKRVNQLLKVHQGSILDLIGNTPLIKLQRINPYEKIEIYAKLEYYNPSGSLKDRMALYLIADALERGKLTPDKTIVEGTSGNTGISLAMIGAVLGYKVLIVMPEDESRERRQMIEAHGAKLLLTQAELGTDGAVDEARKLGETDEYVWLAQHYNPANSFAHYETTGKEILEQLGRVDAFIAPTGTTGTLMGVSARLKEHNPNTKIIAVYPKDDISGLRRPEGDHKPGIYEEARIDEIIEITNAEAIRTMRELCLKEGLFAGPSSGAAVATALQVAERFAKTHKLAKIVALLPDSGDRYLSAFNEFKKGDLWNEGLGRDQKTF